MNFLLRFGEFELDTSSHTLRRRGQAVPLPPKAVDALEILFSEPGRVFSRPELIEALWPGRVIEEQGLTQLVYLLRRALGKRPGGTHWIATLPKRGYRFDGEVRRLARMPLARPADGRTRSVAVWPIEELAGVEPGSGFAFADAVAAVLARRPELVVRPLAAMSGVLSEPLDPRDGMSRAGVEMLVEGSIRLVDSRLCVTIRLWTAGHDRSVWSHEIEGSVDALADIEDAACEALLGKLGLTPAGSGAAVSRAHRTLDPAVRAHVLRSRHLWNLWTPSAWRSSITEARAALALDPGHAEARCWWAMSLTGLAITGQEPADETFRFARILLHEAGRIDPDLDRVWEGLAAVALFHDWDPATAMDHLRRSITFHPGNAAARDLYALALAASGDLDQAIVEMDAAHEIDFLLPITATDAAWLRYFARHYDAAEAGLRGVLAIHPHFAHARLYLGIVLARQGRGVESELEILRGLGDCGRAPETSSELALALVVQGRNEAAERIFAALVHKGGREHVDPCEPMSVCLALNRLDEAMDWLERARRTRSRPVIYILVDPLFDPLRERQDFQDLVRRVFPHRLG
ncbi:MAG TPA: winged helix-turn-helix domain-containing protein [Xanthomonadaceae bacterium]|nr:winged helix-turn-helix domain-containing protein [Xanthomonadaceae bacterium]